MVCRKWREGRCDGEGAGRIERGQDRDEKRDRQKREKQRGRVKRSWNGYETNSDLIWRVYDCFPFFFSGTEMQAGIRRGGGFRMSSKRGERREHIVLSI